SRVLTQAAHEALGGAPGTRSLVVDPFAGGGAIPLEALRVGTDAFASDLNPIPVLLNKVVLEYIPKYGQRLADEVRKWGEWIKREAEKELAEFYPKDKESGTPIAYIWARTVLSEAPGDGEFPIEVPLISSMWLSKKPHRGRALRWVRGKDGQVQCAKVEMNYSDGRNLTVRQPLLEVFEPSRPSEVEQGTVRRGSATCPVTGYTTPVERVRVQLQARKGGTRDARLVCVVSTRSTQKGRFYSIPSKKELDAVGAATSQLVRIQADTHAPLPLVPHEEISLNEIRRISIPLYGMGAWGDAFSNRQLLALVTLVRLVREAGEHCRRANSGEGAFSQAVQTLLAINVGKAADYGSALATWSSPASQETVRSTFSRQAIGMVWDYAEANPFAASSGGWSHNLSFLEKLIAAVTESDLQATTVEQASATNHPLPNDSAHALITDPPYYDAVPYAHLSDFFYVWLRRATPQNLNALFTSDAVQKDAEIVVDRPHYLSKSQKDIAFYERELAKAFADGRRVVAPDGIGTVVFASKSTASWEAILKALIDAGWTITGSWPIDTEREGRMAAIGQARLASSVHLVCRPREHPDGSVRTDEIGDWRDVLTELPRRIHEWMPRLATEGVVGADAIFACLGPALEVFSRYSRVEKASGEVVTLKEYLEQVWAAVAKEALTMIFTGADATGFEEDARLTAMWLWTLKTGDVNGGDGEAAGEDSGDDEEEGGKKGGSGGFVLEFDAARKIAQGLGAHLEDLANVVEMAGESARLLPVAERAQALFGKYGGKAATVRKKREPQMDLFKAMRGGEAAQATFGDTKVERIGATVLDRVHQSMILFAAGRSEALKRFLVEDGAGNDTRFWTLAQALSALYPASTEEKRWVDGVLARKKGLGF
ncbi:MAG TPA: DUF1156 domain-containing protein, partial [Clostridia bacterium]|nr:DUF1156 domain-containing protein [Clostridia bacterium]